jgi:hypothetical protein
MKINSPSFTVNLIEEALHLKLKPLIGDAPSYG